MKFYVNAIVFSLLPSFVHSQTLERQAVLSSGFFVENTVGSLSYTVGESVTVLGSTNSHFLLQGFQQPIPFIRTSITVVGSNEPCKFSIFPNPTTESLNFKDNTLTTVFEIIDITGKSYGVFALQNGQIDVTSLSAGTYFVRSKCDDLNEFAQKFVKL